jgi:hypothetical protein
MILKIQNDTPISEISMKFQRRFPYLKLEFFGPSSMPQEKFSKANILTDGSLAVSTIRSFKQSGIININEQQSVTELEHEFSSIFGLNVQVFRKSGNAWLETTNTDEWSLAVQSSKGKEKDTAFKEESLPDDIHEQL